MIDKLTKEQEEKIPYYFDKWKKIGLEYKSIDREKAKSDLLKYVSIIDIQPKNFLFFDSPLACELAINILKNHAQLHAQLGTQLDTQLHTQFHAQLRNQLYNQLDTQLRNQLYTQLYTQLGNQLHAQLGNQLHAQLRNQLDTQLYNQLHAQLRNQLHAQPRNQLHAQLRNQLHAQLYNQLDTQLGNQLGTQLGKMKLEYYIIYYWYQSGNIISGYCAFYDYLISEVKKIDNKTMKIWNDFKSICENLHYFFIFKDFVFCSEKPIELYYKGNFLHNENGASLKYADGYSIYSLNGVRVSKEIVETPAEKLDCQLIITEKNAEIRREIVRKIGIKRIMKELNAEIIETKNNYELLNLRIDNRNRYYLKMINPSINTFHIEGVHPECDTINKALNWRNGLNVWQEPIMLT